MSYVYRGPIVEVWKYELNQYDGKFTSPQPEWLLQLIDSGNVSISSNTCIITFDDGESQEVQLGQYLVYDMKNNNLFAVDENLLNALFINIDELTRLNNRS